MNRLEVNNTYQFIIVCILTSLFLSCKGQVLDNPISNLIQSVGEEAAVSVLVIHAEKDSVIKNYQSKQRQIPASLLKLATTAACLDILKDTFQFQTRAFYKGLINKNTLVGDLIVLGGGDPTLGSEHFSNNETNHISFFNRIYSGLREKKIKAISGDLLLIDDYFGEPTIPSKRLWEDIGNYYAAIPHGLSYRDNTFKLSLKSPKEVGAKCFLINVEPILNDITFKCDVIAADNYLDNAYIYGVPNLMQWSIRGTIPKDHSSFEIKGALPNPAKVLGDELKHYLLLKGISVNGIARVISSADYNNDRIQVLATHDSPELAEIVNIINKRSNNLFADHLFLELGKHHSEKTTWTESANTLRHYWKKKADIEINIYDGSGLSPMNSLSAFDLVQILKQAQNADYSNAFQSSLSVGGSSGTLKNMWKTHKGRVIGKSGSMKGVLGYAGYVKTLNEEPYIFAIIVNHSSKPLSVLRKSIELLITDVIENY